MDIRVDSLIEGASRAEGTVVVVDVFRAFTTAAVAFSRGAEKIIFVADIEDALDLRDRGMGELCMGEVGGMRPEGFDLGNSPFEMTNADVGGKTLIQSTRAGTVGVASVGDADGIYACALVNAIATARAILRDGPELVTIVAMGWEGRTRTDEDELCAWYLTNLLQGRHPEQGAVRALVRVGEHSQKFGDQNLAHYHPRDIEIALEIDSLAIAIRVDRTDGMLVASPEAVLQRPGEI